MRTVHGGRKALLITLQLAVLTAFIAFVAARPGGDIAQAAETKTWTGAGANANWSTALNWSPSGAPVAGDSLVFGGGGVQLTNVNDLPAGTSFQSMSFTGSSYVISGNAIQLVDGLELTDGTADVDLNIGGAGGVIVDGGNVRLNGANTFTGTTEVIDGRLVAGSNGALGTAAGVTLLKGGILEFVDGVLTNEPIVAQDANSEVMTSGDVELTGPIDLQATIAIVPEGTGSFIIDGLVSGGGGLIKAGTGAVVFTAANTYAGATTIEAGTLRLFGAGRLGAGAGATIVEAGATLALQSGGSIEGESVTIFGNGQAGGGAIRALSPGATAGTVTLGANATIFVDTGATFELKTGLATSNPAFLLTKAGAGTLLISAAAIVVPDITLAAGVLSSDADSSGDLLVTGGTLSGNGSFVSIVFQGGRLLPGDAGEGRLESNTLVAQSGVTFSFLVAQAGAGSYWVTGTGAAINLGGATLEILGAGAITPGTTFVLLQAPASGITGTFAGLPDDAIFADAAGRFWRIEYNNAATHTVSIVALANLEANLGVDLTSAATVPQDTQNFLLNVILSNAAATPMPGVKVNITLPNGVEFVSGPAGCVGPAEDDVPQVVVCGVASLAPGQTTLTLTLKVTAPSGATLIFFAQIDWPGDDPTPGNNTDTHSVTVTPPDTLPFRYFLPFVASDGPN